MITKAIVNNFDVALQRRWDKTYWAFDIHGTIIIPNYTIEHIPTIMYPHAKETLQMITKRKDITTILYTCSHPEEIEEYTKFFAKHDIAFDYVNENPEVVTGKNNKYGNYEKKSYWNVLLEDKAGFSGMEDWLEVKRLLEIYPESLLQQFAKERK